MASLSRPLPALLVALLAPQIATAQPAPPPPQSVDLRYTGATARVGIGYDTDNNLRGEGYWVLREDERSTLIGEAWAATSSAAGLKLSYQWLPEETERASGVFKLFGAVDQNRYRDRKVTLGAGFENSRWFWSAYGTAGVTGRREVLFEQATTVQTTTGADAGGQYEQDLFTTVTKQQFARAWDGGVGARAGHWYEAALVRVNAGADYEWGRGGASQTTLALGVEKFFDGSPFSVALYGEAYRKHGEYETNSNDQRLTVMLRYEFGGPSWRPAKEYRRVQVDVPAPVAATPPIAPVAIAAAPVAPRVEKRLVKTTGSASADAFFELDQAVLQPQARVALDATLARLKEKGFEGNLRVSGHTCDLGTAAHNQRLSERRAKSVRDYLVAGGIPADRIVFEGMGPREPRFANDATGRPKNRRVDIEFVAIEERVVEVQLPAAAPAAPKAVVAPAPVAAAPQVEWRQEEIATEPAWLRRALHNTPQYKQSVDTYTTQTLTTATASGDKRYVNRPPMAAPDAFSVESGATSTLDVLANDKDPDGDALSITAVGAPAHGTASVSGTKIIYRATPGYVGADTFSYTVSDGKGLTSSANVTITVTNTNRVPVAQDDYAQAGYNQPVTIAVLANDSDPDGDTLAVTAFTQPENGKVTRGAGTTLVYAANLNWIGYDKFTYTVSDGRGGTATAQVLVWADP